MFTVIESKHIKSTGRICDYNLLSSSLSFLDLNQRHDSGTSNPFSFPLKKVLSQVLQCVPPKSILGSGFISEEPDN